MNSPRPHDFELILMYETAELKDHDAEVCYQILSFWLSGFSALHVHTETYRVSPDPSFSVHDIETDPS